MRSIIRSNRVLWTVQVLLAALFLFAGGMKLVLPIEALKGPIAFPELFLRFIGVAEVCGALGLIFPSLLRIRPELTPIAAIGLVIIMIGATVTTLASGMIGGAAVPFVVGVLASVIVYGRWSFTSARWSARRTTLQHAS